MLKYITILQILIVQTGFFPFYNPVGFYPDRFVVWLDHMNDKTDLKNVLIIDDDDEYMNFLRKYLAHKNKSINLETYNPNELGMPPDDFDWGKYDLLILDYYLSDSLTGIDIMEANKQNPLLPGIIVLTGASSEEVAIRALKFGVFDYLRKDHLDKEMLYQSIMEAVEKTRAQRKRINTLAELRRLAISEAQKILVQHKAKLDAAQREAIARLTDERNKLQEKQAEINANLKKIAASKKEIETKKQALVGELNKLKAKANKNKADDSTKSKSELTGKLDKVNKDLSQAEQLQQETQDEKQRTDWKLNQEAEMREQLTDEINDFIEEVETEEWRAGRISARRDNLEQIKMGTAAAKKAKQKQKDKELLSEISNQLDQEDE